MKSNNKSVLNIKELILVTATLVIFGICAQQIISNENLKISRDDQEKVENIQVAEITRNIIVTSRGIVDRLEQPVEEVVEEVVIEENPYIPIDKITISRDMDLTQRCGISKEDFKILMDNISADTSNFFFDNSDIIYDLCEKYEINEIFFCGLIAGESGWNIASNHRVKCNYISMMGSSGSMLTFSSVEEGLEAAAKLLHNKYLTEGGSFYSGKTLSAIQRKFCPNSSTWVNLIYTCMSKIV